MSLLSRLFGGLRNPNAGGLVNSDPKVLLVSLGAEPTESDILAQDRICYAPYRHVDTHLVTTIAALLALIQAENAQVLHLDVTIDAQGMIGEESANTLFSGLNDTGVSLLIIARGNPVEHYLVTNSGKAPRYAVVLTLNRRGDLFTTFFRSLFERMAAGQSMPQAWGALVPQHDGKHQENLPETIYLATNGQLRLPAS